MNDELNDEEKAKLIQVAGKWLEPIAQRYELDNPIGRSALLEAFQAGIKFVVHQQKEADKNGN